MADGDMPRARFHSMCDGTKEDWDCISQAMKPFIVELPDRVLTHLKLLQGDCGGFAVDRLEHCLQTATRAYRDGRDEEYVVCALLHDMGDILGPRNHADVAAAILSRSSPSRVTGWSRSTRSSRAITSSITSGSIATCAISSA